MEERKIKELEKDARDRARFKPGDTKGLREIQESIEAHKAKLAHLKSSFPAGWTDVRKTYVKLADAEKSARRIYRRDTDEAYEPVNELRKVVAATSALAGVEGAMTALGKTVADAKPKDGVAAVQAVEAQLTPVAGSVPIKNALSRVRRALDNDSPDRAKAAEELAKAASIFTDDLTWRRKAEGALSAGLAVYDEAIRSTIGARSQPRLSKPQADAVASCQSHHRDISLDF